MSPTPMPMPTPASVPTVYISAPFELFDHARRLRAQLQGLGIRVQARWMDEEVPEYNPHDVGATATRNAQWANNDLEDISLVDAVVLINPGAWKHKGSGGRHTEIGYALNCAIPIFILGERTNVFHYLPGIDLLPWPLEGLYILADRIRDRVALMHAPPV